MSDQPNPGPLTCPDCGGILHGVGQEPLISADAARAAADNPVLLYQCLICGYTQARHAERPSGEAPALA
jgi:hypothetical protein